MQIKNYYLGFNVKLFLVSIIYALFVNFVARKEEVLSNEHSRRHAFILLHTNSSSSPRKDYTVPKEYYQNQNVPTLLKTQLIKQISMIHCYLANQSKSNLELVSFALPKNFQSTKSRNFQVKQTKHAYDFKTYEAK